MRAQAPTDESAGRSASTSDIIDFGVGDKARTVTCFAIKNRLDSLTERRLCNIAHVTERERPL